MDTVREILGEELYGKVREKLGKDKSLIIDDGMLIPKHRFDCINLSLKEHKKLVAALREEIAALKKDAETSGEAERELDELRKEISVLELVMRSKPKNYVAVRSNIHVADPVGKRLECSVKKQISAMKKSDPYLFYENEVLYRLVPADGHTEQK